MAPVTLPRRITQALNPASVRTARRPSFYSFSFLSAELLKIRAGYHSAQAVTKKTLFARYKVAIVSIASVLVSGSGIAGIYFGQRSALKSDAVEVQAPAVSTAAASDSPAPEAPKENSGSMPARRAAAERVARSGGESSGPAAAAPATVAEKVGAPSAPVDKDDPPNPTAQVAATKQDLPAGLSATFNESLPHPEKGVLSTPSLDLVAPVASLPAATESGAILSTPARTGGNLREPRLVSSTPPDYPPVAKQVGIEGAVVVNGVIDGSGRVTHMRAISGPALLRGAAIDAIRKWKYEPTVLNGNVVPIEVNITVQFRLH
jgi:TonB family protein